MASLLTVEAVLRSLIIIGHSCKGDKSICVSLHKALFEASCLFTHLRNNIRHSYKLSWDLFVEGPGMFSHLESRSENSNLMITVGAVLFTYS